MPYKSKEYYQLHKDEYLLYLKEQEALRKEKWEKSQEKRLTLAIETYKESEERKGNLLKKYHSTSFLQFKKRRRLGKEVMEEKKKNEEINDVISMIYKETKEDIL